MCWLKSKCYGFSLIEVFISLIIFSVIIISLQPDIFNNYPIATKTRAYSIASMFEQGSNMALTGGTEIILCPSPDERNCSGNWNTDKLILFVNGNTNARRDNSEKIISRLSTSSSTSMFFNRGYTPRYLRWYATGHINQSLSLTLCPSSKSHAQQQKSSRVIIVSLMARVREGTDNNNDGIPELADGSAAYCG